MKMKSAVETQYERMKNLRLRHKDIYERLLEMLAETEIDEKIRLGKRVVQHMLNNPAFEDSCPSVEFLQFITEELDVANYEEQVGLAKSDRALAVNEEFFDLAFATIVVYVVSVAKRSERIYRNAGLAPILEMLLKK